MEEAPFDGDQAAAGRDRSSGKTGKRGKRKSVKQSKSKAKPPLAIAMVEGPADGPPDRPEPEIRQEPVDHAVPHQHSALSVLVLKDSGPYPRACFWEHALQRLHHTVKLRSLVDPDEFFIKELNQYQVLIVNWDAINGDPSFGSDAALRWSEHRHPEVRWWVQSKGGILIIEGQARLSVPTQAAYDALLGPGQLRVSGPSDPSRAGIEEHRVGERCRVTKRVGPNTPLGPFKGRVIGSEQRTRAFEDMFPGAAGDLLLPLAPTDVEGRQRGWDSLYRGWFTPRLPRPLAGWKLSWVRLVETANRDRYERPHATMMAARDGNGAVFATTMWLSNLNEDDLGFIDAILHYHNRVVELPESTRISSFLQTHLREVINLVVAVVFVGLANGSPGLLQSDAEWLQRFFHLEPFAEWVQRHSTLEPIFELVLQLALLGAVLALVYFALWLRRRVKEMFGL